ncbi:transposase [Streptomyces fulvoviolaceus]|uniref:transposase n=1 Tax=Streptomyces fulvoviolaceus TaxID=285535 RepID=UPI0030B82A94
MVWGVGIFLMSRRVRAGVPWRDLPREYGPWQTVYGLFRRWHRAGIRARFLTLLRARADTTGLITWEANVDSTICRVHRHVAGARGDHGLGRSRGGFTTKIHQPLPPTRRPLPARLRPWQRQTDQNRSHHQDLRPEY